jgi:hypothetical protein
MIDLLSSGCQAGAHRRLHVFNLRSPGRARGSGRPIGAEGADARRANPVTASAFRARAGWHGALKFLKIINKRLDRSLSRTALVQRFAIAGQNECVS